MAYVNQIIFYCEKQVHFLDQDTEKTEAASDWTRDWVHQLYNLHNTPTMSENTKKFG